MIILNFLLFLNYCMDNVSNYQLAFRAFREFPLNKILCARVVPLNKIYLKYNIKLCICLCIFLLEPKTQESVKIDLQISTEAFFPFKCCFIFYYAFFLMKKILKLLSKAISTAY